MEDNKQMAVACARRTSSPTSTRIPRTASMLENFIDETERRTWFLFEASRQEGSNAA